MSWGRGLVAVVLSVLVLGGLGHTALQMSGVVKPLVLRPSHIGVVEEALLARPYADLVAGRVDALAQQLAEGDIAETQRISTQLEKARATIPAGPPISDRFTDWDQFFGVSSTREITYPQRVVRVDTWLSRSYDSDARKRSAGALLMRDPRARDSREQQAPALLKRPRELKWKVQRFSVRTAMPAELARNRPILEGRSPAYVAFMVAFFAVPLFQLATAMAALFMPGTGDRERAFVAMIMITSIGTLSMDTASGVIDFALHARPLSASAYWSGSAFDPWKLELSAPVGAIAFWMWWAFKRVVLTDGAVQPRAA